MPQLFKRPLALHLAQDLHRKILIVTGPRQCGKTTLARQLGSSFDYLNFDEREHHKTILKKAWDRRKEYIIFDELHKKKGWKLWLKGIYDTEGVPPGLLVTGSARLDIYKRMGDSLAGRFFHFRLHPFDPKEIQQLRIGSPEEAVERIRLFSGFPEPFLTASRSFYGKWKKTCLDAILRQDLVNFEHIKHLSSIETLVQLLRDRVGSPVSYSSLAEDLHCAPKTVKNWLRILENLYVVFKITPWHKNIAKSLLKAPKFYFYDTAQVRDPAAQAENCVACALLKEAHWQADVNGEEYNLFYLRDKNKKEVDFLISKSNQPFCMIEVKSSQEALSDGMRLFAKKFPSIQKIQLVFRLKREKTFPGGEEIRKAAPWLAGLNFQTMRPFLSKQKNQSADPL